ncbi:hypothetical protein KQX54_019957 [Cotesia glomerata]|uniref:Uncharacterized protein n=1 Tax=Cotesia glomerata TaxID=32391 RepID=A0AAV7HGI6_COTGL|nr:hypothetical protein KQX54_019957 [Cotesia glomerata]
MDSRSSLGAYTAPSGARAGAESGKQQCQSVGHTGDGQRRQFDGVYVKKNEERRDEIRRKKKEERRKKGVVKRNFKICLPVVEPPKKTLLLASRRSRLGWEMLSFIPWEREKRPYYKSIMWVGKRTEQGEVEEGESLVPGLRLGHMECPRSEAGRQAVNLTAVTMPLTTRGLLSSVGSQPNERHTLCTKDIRDIL